VRDLDRTLAEFAKFSKKDADAYRRLLGEFDAIKPVLNRRQLRAIGFRQVRSTIA